MLKNSITTLILGIFLITNTYAQKNKKDKKEEEKWDISNPKGAFNYKDHTFSTDEGTWMNLDVSPDGKTIVFDLMGDIYSIPIAVGKVKLPIKLFIGIKNHKVLCDPDVDAI